MATTSPLQNTGDNPPIENFQAPSKALINMLAAFQRFYFDPTYYGMDNIDPEKPALLVTNHTVYGLTDGSLISAEIYDKKGIFARALVDKSHFGVPVWPDLLEAFGAVKGSREHCSRLMNSGQFVMVYPGGSREACKQKGEKYQLTWKQRTGFAKMAIEHGYPIIPIAVLGGDDAFDIIMDSNEIMKTVAGDLLKLSGLAYSTFKQGEHLPPLGRGIGPTLIPKPVKLYHSIGKPIDTSAYAGKASDKSIQWEVRKQVESQMYDQFTFLKDKRKEDLEMPLWRKILQGL